MKALGMMSGTRPDAIDARALAAALPEVGEGALRRTRAAPGSRRR